MQLLPLPTEIWKRYIRVWTCWTNQTIGIAFKSFVITIHWKKLTSEKIKELQELSKEHFKDLKKDDPGGAQQAHCKMVNDGLSNFADTIPDMIQKKFGNSKNEIQAIYDRQMNSLVESVLVFQLGFLEKKVIVFPINFQNIHWGGAHLFSTKVKFPVPSIKEWRDLWGLAFFDIAACILPVQEGFQTKRHYLVP